MAVLHRTGWAFLVHLGENLCFGVLKQAQLQQTEALERDAKQTKQER